KNHLIPMKGRMMHDQKGALTFQPYGKEEQSINSISRGELNKTLISIAEKDGVRFEFANRCENVDLNDCEFQVITDEQTSIHSTDVVIGADGAFSALRKSMEYVDRFDYHQKYIGHGYKELSMPPTNNGFAMEPNYLHIWPRGNFMLIALPNPDQTFTCTLFLGFEGAYSFENLQDPSSVQQFFEVYFPDVMPLVPDLLDQFGKNPTSSLVTIRCHPWYSGRCFLIGDAAHAIVPFYGQGMNAAFEDCRILCEMGKEIGFDWDQLIPTFCDRRKKDADAIADLALRNFIEMRDDVGDVDFLERKKVDALMHEQFGEEWIPMYSMVTFTDIPYHVALERGTLQEEILRTAQKENFLSDHERIRSLLPG
ncbi:MAG: FAD-dependent monooxygenase, partial [Proteobacteria bacterium]|nr:FAD-dependent monooxygenase [Pseudomonadota bacterium]